MATGTVHAGLRERNREVGVQIEDRVLLREKLDHEQRIFRVADKKAPVFS